jgi:division protein CdvB (Snf7/Vps24/ESCRT-III family)
MNIKESIVLPMSMEEEYKNAGVESDSLDLEARIERLEFTNEKLHKYVNKLMVENKQLREQLEKVVDEYRNKGEL